MGLKYHGAPQVCDFLTWGVALTVLLHAGLSKQGQSPNFPLTLLLLSVPAKIDRNPKDPYTLPTQPMLHWESQTPLSLSNVDKTSYLQA